MSLCKSKLSDILLLLFLIIIAGMKQTIFPHDNAWDLVNYHYYNAWAFLEGRLGYDITPATFHTFFNPLIDLPFYFMAKYFNDMPHLIAFLQGTWGGCLLFIFYKVVLLFFDKEHDKLKIFLALLIAATGFSFLSQVGTTTNEIQISCLILLGIYLILKHINELQRDKKVWIYAGLLMGMALGFKPTVITYCLAMGATLIICAKPLNVSIKEIILFAFFGLVGYLLINGWWMWQLYSHFDNPFFPFLNKVFHSSYFIDENYRDARYTDISLIKKILLPFYFSSYTKRYVSEVWFHDFRFAIAYVILILCFIRWGLKDKFQIQSDRRKLLFYAFFVTAYLVWLNLFSIIRYAIILELFIALIIIEFFATISTRYFYQKAGLLTIELIGIFVLISGAAEYVRTWEYISGEQEYIEMEKIALPDNTLIKLYGFPSAMPAVLMTKDNKSIRLLGYANRDYRIPEDFMEVTTFHQERDEIEKNHKGITVALVSNFWGNVDEQLQNLKKTGMYCRRLEFSLWQTEICVPEKLKNEILEEKNENGEQK